VGLIKTKAKNMGRKSRNENSRHPKKNNIKIPGNISWNMKLSDLQITSKQKDATCEIRDCELPKLIGLLADIATGIWRLKKKFSAVKIDDLPDEIKKAHRHLESIWDALSSAKVKVRDHTGEKYPHGNPQLDAIAFQPSSSLHVEMITETIKPSIFYNDKLIQRGEVIVATPDTTELKNNSKTGNSSDNKERSGE
jgi:hypothetical protein